MNRIRKNDVVYVISGKDKGKTGKVLFVDPAKSSAIVEGINYVKKATRRTREDQTGGIITKESPIELSNIMIFCQRCQRATRVDFELLADGTKQRICKKCKEIL